MGRNPERLGAGRQADRNFELSVPNSQLLLTDSACIP